jgi:hypothetical protein
MSPEPPRPKEQRKRDTLARLSERDVDVWVATSSAAPDGTSRPYLVPLSLAWVDDRLVVALEATSRTARNLLEVGHARLGLGPTRDLAMIDAEVEAVIDAAELEPRLGDAYVAQVGWDPRRESGAYVFVILRPDRIQAWREANEIAGRTVMTDGSWLV